MFHEARTVVDALERLPRRPGRGLRFVGTDGLERFFTYEQVWQEARRRAGHLAARGLRRGDRLALVVPEGHEFVLTFLGAVVAGLVPVPIYPSATFKRIEGYADVVGHIVEAAGARALLTMERMKPYLEGVFARATGLETLLLTETAFAGADASFAPPAADPQDLCFLQFTSGSTARPKGVMVTHANVVANARACLGPQGLDINDDDVTVSWLPLYHDMGLGFVFSSLIGDLPAVFMPTASFARAPRVWLEALCKYRGTITYAPNFAYQLVTKRLRDRDLEELDLRHVRVAGCGAEPIRASALLGFADRLSPTGFDGGKALLPCYGMAESTLAITFHELGTPVRLDRVDAEAMRLGEARPASAATARTLEIVSCGKPFPEHELAIVGEDGRRLGERKVGEIVASGPSVTSGYYNSPEATAEGWKDGWLHTGDLGYTVDGNLHVCGRKKDLIIINGTNHHPQDIEWLVADLDKVRRGNVVAFGVMEDGREDLVVLAEGNPADAPDLRKAIAEKIADGYGLQPARVSIVAVGMLPRTSSGKVQRRKSRQMFEDGELPECG
jgi:acyl-CoA synthetase (AMP-forming)/AMP-acid ligase II